MSLILEAVEDLKVILLKYSKAYINGDEEAYTIVKGIGKSIEELVDLRGLETVKNGSIPEELKLPKYITNLMEKWLLQYKYDFIGDITYLGLFDYDNESKKIPKIINRTQLKSGVIDRSIYFKEIGYNKLLVFESSGVPLSGLKTIYEYEFISDGVFIKNDKAIFSMIS